jgi:ribonuclease HI
VREFLNREQGYGTAILYTDASGMNVISGCTVVRGSGRGPIEMIYQATIGWASTCPVLSAELQAIKQAVDYIVPVRSWSYHNYIIATDSQDAIKAVKKGNTATKNREALQSVLESLEKAERYKVDIRLMWVPGHQDILENELAHVAAQNTTKLGSKPTNDRTARIREYRAVRDLVAKEVKRQVVESLRETSLGT